MKITPIQAFLPDKLCHLTIILSSTSGSSLVQWLIAICGSQHPRWLPTTITSHTESLLALGNQQNTAEVMVLTLEARFFKKRY